MAEEEVIEACITDFDLDNFELPSNTCADMVWCSLLRSKGFRFHNDGLLSEGIDPSPLPLGTMMVDYSAGGRLTKIKQTIQE